MPAQIHLECWREPTKIEGCVPLHHECRLCKVVLSRNRLKDMVRQPIRKQTNPGRIARKKSARERIDLVIGNTHSLIKQPRFLSRLENGNLRTFESVGNKLSHASYFDSIDGIHNTLVRRTSWLRLRTPHRRRLSKSLLEQFPCAYQKHHQRNNHQRPIP